MSQLIPELADWLNIATKNLALPATERIGLEIISHFDDAVGFYQAEGMAEAEAQAKALADLGDPAAAAKRFRKEHLTEGDVGSIKWLIKYYWFWPLYNCCLLVMFNRDHHLGFASLATASLCLIAGPIGLLMMARWRKPVPELRWLMAVQILSRCNFAILVFAGLWPTAAGCVLTLFYLCGTYCDSLWLKLRRIGDVWQKLPPPGATAA